MAAQTHSRAGAPRKLGPWWFAGLWIVFWALLVVSGFDRFKAPDGNGRLYMLSAAQLTGVTRLRIDGEPGDADAYASPPRLVLSGSSVVTVSVQSRSDGRRRGSSRGDPRPGPRAEPPLVAVREGDTLVLRWLQRPALPDAQATHANDEWIGEIVLPMQFKDLALSNAQVDAMDPVERLSVSGRSVEVRGSVAHLDLQSTRCGRCAASDAKGTISQNGEDDCETRPRYRREDTLEVSAAKMQSVRIVASVGQVTLKDTEGLQQLELRLGDSVALSVDRAGALKLARNAAEDASSGTAAVSARDCAASNGPRREAANATPLDWTRMGDSSPAAR